MSSIIYYFISLWLEGKLRGIREIFGGIYGFLKFKKVMGEYLGSLLRLQ